MMQGTTRTTTTAPAPAPFNLDDRIDRGRAILWVIGMVVGVIIFSIGAGVAGALGLAEDPESRSLGGWVALVAGAALGLAGAAVFVLSLWSLWSLVSYEINARRTWQAQILEERRAAGGVVRVESESEWNLTASDPRDLLLVAIACYWQAQRGTPAPWSVRNMRRLEISTGSGSTLIGEASEDQARAFAQLLERAGIITGRRERSAGELAINTADELIERIMPLLRKGV